MTSHPDSLRALVHNEALRVINAESGAVQQLSDIDREDFYRVVCLIKDCAGKVVLTGVGKSGIIAQKIAATFASTGTPALFLHASDALHGDVGVVASSDLLLMLSKSGATHELVILGRKCRELGVPTIGIFSSRTTPAAQYCDSLLVLPQVQEACPLDLAPTTSTTMQLVVGDALALAVMKCSGFDAEAFHARHPAGSLGRLAPIKAADVMHSGAGLPICSKDARLRDVVLELTRTHLGAVGLCSADSVLVGLVTDGDIRRAFESNLSLDTPVTSIMTANPRTASPDTKGTDLLRNMQSSSREISVIPVVNKRGVYLGLVRLHDLLPKF
jgi:arabinose-5-phosphate isomerase